MLPRCDIITVQHDKRPVAVSFVKRLDRVLERLDATQEPPPASTVPAEAVQRPADRTAACMASIDIKRRRALQSLAMHIV